MSPSPVNERLISLLAQADEASAADQLPKSAALLREASQLSPEDDEVKKRWLALQDRQSGVGALEAVRLYVASGRAEDGHKALQALGQEQISADEASEAYNLLFPEDSLPLLDDLFETLLGRQLEARKLIAAKLASSAIPVFEQLSSQGDKTFQAFVSIPLDNVSWSSKDAQATAQRDLFRLCIATLMEAGVDRPDRLMGAITRQLAMQPDNVTDLINKDVFDVVLSELDIRHESSLRSQAMISASKLLETSKEKSEKLFSDFVTGHVAKETVHDLILAFSAAAAVFSILPAVASKLFQTEGFVQSLVPNIARNSEAATAGERKDRTLEQAALELLSAACVEKACRDIVNRYCLDWLRGLSTERDGKHKGLATLVLAKISEQSVDDITAKLSALVVNGDGEKDQAIEGLAYTSLQPKAKESIANNTALLEMLATALKDRPTSAFGALTVLSNLTVYRAVQSAEAKNMSQLKAYANQSKPAPEDPLDNDKYVTARCKKVLDAEVVPAVVACCKQTTSPTNIALIVRILLSLAKEQKHRSKMAQQGAVRLLLQICERTAKLDKSTSGAALIQRNAAHALARLLISVNPAHVFTSGLPATTAVSALIPQLSDDGAGEQKDLLPIFESLLALTNLASMEDPAARDLAIRSAFDKIEELLFSPNILIQRASVELVCNLMASPIGVAEFADGSTDAKRRMQILLALADVDDLPTRRAAGGALAMLTEWDLAASAVLEAKEGRGVKAVLGMCEDESEEMRHRGLVCVSNLVGADGEAGSRAITMVKERDGAGVLRRALKESKNPELLKVGVEALKRLV